MKRFLGVILLMVLVVAGAKGWRIFKKIRHARRLKISLAKFKLLKLSTQIDSNIVLQIGNFSSSTFKINQVSIDLYTTTEEVLAAQKAPLLSPITITPNKNTLLPIGYKINLPVALNQLKRIGGIATVATNYLTTGKNGLTLVLKGFIEADGVTISINETINV